MNKKHAFLFSLLITLIIFSDLLILSPPSQKNLETVLVSRVIDGDTFVLDDGRKVRLLNINSPEKSSEIYSLSLSKLKSLENKSINIEIIGKDKYNRNLARVYSPDYLNLELVSLGLASKFLVQDSELKDFSRAEKKAIESSFGIWNHSVYYDCLTSEIDKNMEFVIILNSCGDISLSSWKIKDESTKVYTFKNISFKKIFLHSGKGEDNDSDIFWNSKTNVWNNDRDSLYIFDSSWNIVHYNSYGY